MQVTFSAPPSPHRYFHTSGDNLKSQSMWLRGYLMLTFPSFPKVSNPSLPSASCHFPTTCIVFGLCVSFCTLTSFSMPTSGHIFNYQPHEIKA
jgi:hypothetical protein